MSSSSVRGLALVVVAGLASLALTGCGASTSQIKKAESSVYDTDYARVWNVVVQSVRKDYPRLAVVDAVHGSLISDWHLIERLGEDSMTAEGAQVLQGGRYFRVAIFIKPGGPPWQVEVDGEAAHFRPGMAMITPYDHDDADEPPWVKVRIQNLRVRIFERLEPYARAVAAPVKRENVLDTSRWANLPEGAATLAARLHAAADKKDLEALREVMTPDFVWSAGGAPGVDAALALWSADPLAVAALRTTLEAGCAERETGFVVCPGRGGGQPGSRRVELRLGPGGWQFAAYYVED